MLTMSSDPSRPPIDPDNGQSAPASSATASDPSARPVETPGPLMWVVDLERIREIRHRLGYVPFFPMVPSNVPLLTREPVRPMTGSMVGNRIILQPREPAPAPVPSTPRAPDDPEPNGSASSSTRPPTSGPAPKKPKDQKRPGRK